MEAEHADGCGTEQGFACTCSFPYVGPPEHRPLSDVMEAVSEEVSRWPDHMRSEESRRVLTELRKPEDFKRAVDEAAARAKGVRSRDARWTTPIMVGAHDLFEAIVVGLSRSWGSRHPIPLCPCGDISPPWSEVVDWGREVIDSWRSRDWSVKVTLLELVPLVVIRLRNIPLFIRAHERGCFDVDAVEQNIGGYLREKVAWIALTSEDKVLFDKLTTVPKLGG